jgi:hypothetical protein
MSPLLIPIVSVIMVFSFLSIAVWVVSQRKEREAFYKSETLRRIAESSGDGAKQAMDLLREQSRLSRINKRETTKVGGLVLVALGLGMVIFMIPMRATDPSVPVLVGLVPGLMGVAVLVYAYKLAGPVE